MEATDHQSPQPLQADFRLTLTGTALVACQCAGLVLTIVALKWRPDSPMGVALSTPAGLAVVALLLSGGLSLVAPILGKLGMPIVERTIKD